RAVLHAPAPCPCDPSFEHPRLRVWFSAQEGSREVCFNQVAAEESEAARPPTKGRIPQPLHVFRVRERLPRFAVELVERGELERPCQARTLRQEREIRNWRGERGDELRVLRREITQLHHALAVQAQKYPQPL